MTIHLGSKRGRGALVLGILGFGAIAAWSREPGPYDVPAGAQPPASADASASTESLEATIAKWPEHSRFAARMMIAKYGDPRSFDADRLVWSDNGPWSKIVVHRRAPGSFLGLGGKNVVEQSIWYDAPDDKLAALKSFDGRLTVNRSTGELSSLAESEELNFLALNLADEIVAGTRTAREARDFYKRTEELSQSGKSSAYTGGILFSLRVPGWPADGPSEGFTP